MKDITLFKNIDTVFLMSIKSKSDLIIGPDGFFLDTSEKEARRILDSLKSRKQKSVIAILGIDDAFNRRALETLKIDYLVSPELASGRDNLKQRDSGLNHVTAKIAKEKGIIILIDFTSISSMKGKLKARRIARVMQNIKICRRTGTKIKIATFAKDKSQLRDKKQLEAFLFSLGMSSKQVKDAFL